MQFGVHNQLNVYINIVYYLHSPFQMQTLNEIHENVGKSLAANRQLPSIFHDLFHCSVLF